MSLNAAECVYQIPEHYPTCIPILSNSQEVILFTLEKAIMFLTLSYGTILLGPDAWLAEQLFSNVHEEVFCNVHEEAVDNFIELSGEAYERLKEKEGGESEEEIETLSAEEAARLDNDDFSMRSIGDVLQINKRGH